jgi:hypothetical protein
MLGIWREYKKMNVSAQRDIAGVVGRGSASDGVTR